MIMALPGQLTAAGGSGNNGNGGGNETIGARLEISGQQVYTMTWEVNDTITISEYKGNLTLVDNNGGTVTITNGKLT